MNRWLWLLLMMLCWVGAGFALFGRQQSKNAVAKSGRPGRIVSVAPNLTEILFALGVGDRIVGVASDSDYPPAALDKAKIGTFWQPNTEAVIALRPDLVVMLDDERQMPFANSLSRAGCRVLTLRLKMIEHLWPAIDRLGRATGAQLQAEQLTDSITERVERLSGRVAGRGKVKTLWVVQSEPLRVAGRDTFIDGIIRLAGGENAIGPTVEKYPRIGAEEVFACGAEVIIEAAMGDDVEQQQEAARVFWRKYPNLPAVRDGRIYVVRPDTVLRLGPRLADGLEMITGRLHPDAF